MSIAAEETEAYGLFSRAVVTGLNFFAMFKINENELKFAGYASEYLNEEQAAQLKEYIRGVQKELRRGILKDASTIQRRMYWLLTKLLEFGLMGSGTSFMRLMGLYQASVCELEED